MKKSLQKIEDKYVKLGLFGSGLTKALIKDKKYIILLREKRKKIKSKFKARLIDERQYVLSTDVDYQILEKIYQLEKKKLARDEKSLVKLIRTQLCQDWRTPLIQELNRLIRKYY